MKAAAATTDGAAIELSRILTDRAIALGAVRLAMAGQFESQTRWDPNSARAHTQVTLTLRTHEHPERADPREEAMAARLLEAATDRSGRWPTVSEYAVCSLVAERGVSWLLDPPSTRAPSAVNAAEPIELTGLERLTTRYAAGQDARTWSERGTPMPARAAVDAALTDPDASVEHILAAIEVLRFLHAELDALDTRAAELVEGKATFVEIGQALGGVTKQSAQGWINARLDRTPTRTRMPRPPQPSSAPKSSHR